MLPLGCAQGAHARPVVTSPALPGDGSWHRWTLSCLSGGGGAGRGAEVPEGCGNVAHKGVKGLHPSLAPPSQGHPVLGAAPKPPQGDPVGAVPVAAKPWHLPRRQGGPAGILGVHERLFCASCRGQGWGSLPGRWHMVASCPPRPHRRARRHRPLPSPALMIHPSPAATRRGGSGSRAGGPWHGRLGGAGGSVPCAPALFPAPR